MLNGSKMSPHELSAVNCNPVNNLSCTEIHVWRMRLAVMWSIIMQFLMLFGFILLINVDLFHPLSWIGNCIYAFMSLDMWVKLVILIVIIYIQGEVCKKDYVTGPIYHHTRVQKLGKVFTVRNMLLLILHMVIGFTVFWIYSSVSGESYRSLTVQCSKQTSSTTDSCFVEEKFFLLLGGFWLGIYYFGKDYMFGSRHLSFPLIQQYKFYRVKAALKQNMKQSVKDSLLPTVWFVILYYFYGGYLRSKIIQLGLVPYCLEKAPIDSVLGLTDLKLLFSLWLFSSIFIVALKMMELLFNVYLTEHCVFPISTTMLPPGNYINLIEALKCVETPIIHHLGFLDLLVLSTKYQHRREEIFTLSHPGGHPHSWNGIFKECTSVIKKFTNELDLALQQSVEIGTVPKAAPPKPEVTSIHFHSHIRRLASPVNEPMVVKPIPDNPQSGIEIVFNNIQIWYYEKLRQLYKKPYIAYLFVESPDSRINYLLNQCQPVIWAVQSLTFLTSASLTEDRYGIVQRDLSDVIITIVNLKQVLDKLFKQTLLVRKSFSNDSLDYQMKHLLRSSVKRSLYKIAVMFGSYIREFQLPTDIEMQMNNFINFKEVL